jgi:hypothetical protein
VLVQTLLNHMVVVEAQLKPSTLVTVALVVAQIVLLLETETPHQPHRHRVMVAVHLLCLMLGQAVVAQLILVVTPQALQ